MKENKKIVVYVDLVNTIADFQSGVDTFSAEVRAQYGKDENGKDHSDEIPGLFSKMKEIDGAKEGFQFLADHFDTYSFQPLLGIILLLGAISWSG